MRLLEDHAETAHATSVRLRQFESGCRGEKGRSLPAGEPKSKSVDSKGLEPFSRRTYRRSSEQSGSHGCIALSITAVSGGAAPRPLPHICQLRRSRTDIVRRVSSCPRRKQHWALG